MKIHTAATFVLIGCFAWGCGEGAADEDEPIGQAQEAYDVIGTTRYMYCARKIYNANGTWSGLYSNCDELVVLQQKLNAYAEGQQLYSVLLKQRGIVRAEILRNLK